MTNLEWFFIAWIAVAFVVWCVRDFRRFSEEYASRINLENTSRRQAKQIKDLEDEVKRLKRTLATPNDEWSDVCVGRF